MRRGQTLLELVAASTIIAVALVPALRIMRDAIRVGRETEMANLIATFSVSKLEQSLAETAGSWSTTTLSGNFASEGYSQVRYVVVRSDSSGDGGIPNVVMAISSTVWEDRDGDSAWDAGELRSVFASKLAKSVAYSNIANGS
jgi:hypothetical protein